MNIKEVRRVVDEINIELKKNGYKNVEARLGEEDIIQIRVRNGDWKRDHWHVRVMAASVLKEFDCVYDYNERVFGKHQCGFVYSAIHEIRVEGMTCYDTLSREKAAAASIPLGYMKLRERKYSEMEDEDQEE